MFGLFSGIGKIFTSLVSGVARVGSALLGIGNTATVATTAAAAAPIAAGGVAQAASTFGGGVISNVLSNVLVKAGVGAAVGAGIGALTGKGAGRGALIGGASGAVFGALGGGGSTPAAAGRQITGLGTGQSQSSYYSAGGPVGRAAGMGSLGGTYAAPSAPVAAAPTLGGVTAAQQATQQPQGLFQRMFSDPETLGGFVKGAGAGIAGWLGQRAEDRRTQQRIDYLIEEQERAQKFADEQRRASEDFAVAQQQRQWDEETGRYNIDPGVLPHNRYRNVAGGGSNNYRPPRYRWDSVRGFA